MNTSTTYPLELLRAELKSAMAEQLVALIDRFATKRDLADFRAEFITHQANDQAEFREINGKLDDLLTEKASRLGVSEERAARGARWYLLLGFAATFVAGVVGAAGSVLANAFFN